MLFFWHSETLLFLHQIFLKGLCARLENWPTLVLGQFHFLLVFCYINPSVLQFNFYRHGIKEKAFNWNNEYCKSGLHVFDFSVLRSVKIYLFLQTVAIYSTIIFFLYLIYSGNKITNYHDFITLSFLNLKCFYVQGICSICCSQCCVYTRNT